MVKKLIEVALPLTEINMATATEKRTTARLAHPAKIHQWWARRPLVATRAVLFAQLVDDPSAHPDKFPDPEAVRNERERLFDVLRGLLKIEGPSREALEAAQVEIRNSVGRSVTILDPFSGGGSIPLEAQRLGVNVAASDLNPVAVLLNRILLDNIQVAFQKSPVHPDSETFVGMISGVGLSGLAEDVEWYGKRLRDLVETEVGGLYPKGLDGSGKQLPVVAWIWTRTVPCPNPGCGIAAPLVRSFMLSKKQGRETWVDPTTEGAGHEVKFEIRHGKIPRVSGTVGRSGATCVACQSAIPLAYIRQKGHDGAIDTRLMAIAALGDRRRVYLPPSEEHEIAARVECSDPFGTELAANKRNITCRTYGMVTHASLFTTRQLTTLKTFVGKLTMIRDEILTSSSSDEAYANLVVTLLGLAVSKAAETSNALSRWLVKDEVPVALFARQAIPMVWDFPEANILGDSSGSFLMTVANIARSISGELVAFERAGLVDVTQANASSREYPQGIVVCTDPPYFDNIAYADLADFFYVWLRIALRDVYPDIFETMLTPKLEELTALPHHHSEDQSRANAHFEAGFRGVFTRIRECHNPDVPMTLYYAYKQEDDEGNDDGGGTGAGATGWEKMLQGVVDAGLQVTATWPMRTEMGNRMIGLGTNSLASSVVLSCRPRSVNAGIIDRQGFIRHLRRELDEKLQELQSGGVLPVDMAQASIGPGMAVFTAYAKVVEGGDRQMSVATALQLINQVLDELQSEQESEFDSDTRWAVTWFAQNGMNTGEFGDAQSIATARGTAVNALEKSGIVEARAGRVRLLARSEYADDWDPTTDKRLTVWEVCQHLIRRVEGEGGLTAAAALLRQVGGLGEAARDLAYRLYEIANRNGWSEEARAYNNLATEWPDLVALAVQAPSDPSTLF